MRNEAWQRSVIIFLLFIAIAGCESLIIRHDDNVAEVAGKVSARVLFGLLTIGGSEIQIDQIKNQGYYGRQAYTGPMDLYNDCVSDLRSTPAWQRIFQEPKDPNWEMQARQLDIEWKQMCMAGAKETGAEQQQAQLDRLEMGQRLILGISISNRCKGEEDTDRLCGVLLLV